MSKITITQIICFSTLATLSLGLAISISLLLLSFFSLGDYRGVVSLIVFIIFIYLFTFAVYRLFLKACPLQEGAIEAGTKAEFAAQVNILFYLIFFNSLIRTHFLPVPLMRLIYQALGAKLGNNTYSAGCLLDPPLIEIGDNCIIGHDAVLFAHAIEGHNFSLSRIKIGHEVTIGALAIIMAGVEVENGAIISAGAVVLKGSHIGAGELWGGVPAKKIR